MPRACKLTTIVKIFGLSGNRCRLSRFRWVDCQLEALRSCPSSEYHLDLMLKSLPESLDETYERMLCNINYHLVEDARRILTLLCFSKWPLTVQELIDGVAVEINGDSSGLNRKRRLQDSNGIRDICGSFIEIYVAKSEGENKDEEKATEIVRIAHFSVQEYLESERIRHQKAANFSLNGITAHAEIAQICLTYLCERGLSYPELNISMIKDHPLTQYAARYWYHHYKNTASLATSLNGFILRLFRCQNSFATWIKVYDPDPQADYYRPKLIIRIGRSLDSIPDPIYYASLLGLDQTLRALISISHDESEVSERINAEGGGLGNALQAASYSGHDHVIRLLLDRGANVNAQGGCFGNALQAACYRGHDHVVHLLLDKGANVNAHGKSYRNSLERLLFNRQKGANVNAKANTFGNALEAASLQGHTQIVQMLLERGANINAQGGKYGNAVQAASYGGHIQTVQLLLDKGACVNAQGGFPYFTALEAASCNGNDEVVELLLDKGADINARGGFHDRNALEAASDQGHDEVVQLLLDNGAVLDAKSLKISLGRAKASGYDRVVQLLQDYEATFRQKLPVSEEP